MLNGYKGMVNQHSRTTPSHHITHPVGHRGTVTMDRAHAACAFRWTKTAPIETPVCILKEGKTFGAKGMRRVMMPAVEPNHKCHYPLLMCNPV